MKMKKNRLRILWFIPTLCSVFMSFGCQQASKDIPVGDWVEHGFSAEKRKALLSLFDEAVENQDIAGGALLVIHQDEVIFRESFGYYDLETKRPFPLDEQCVIASVSKSISSTLMVILEEKGYFSFEDPVEKYIPSFVDIQLREGGNPEDPPRVWHTLSHRSGLPGNADIEEGNPVSRGTLAEVVEALAEYGLLAEPGTRYAYSEAGYKTGGRVAEAATGKSFEELLKENVLDPLGMSHTTFHPDREVTEEWPRAYQRKEGELESLSAEFVENFMSAGIDPGGSLFSTLDDMGKFVLFHLNHGRVDGKPLVSEEALSRMYTHPEGAAGPPYGLGLAVGPRGPGQARHLGGSGTFIWFDFEQDLGGFLLTQTGWRGNQAFQRKLMQTIQSTFEEERSAE